MHGRGSGASRPEEPAGRDAYGTFQAAPRCCSGTKASRGRGSLAASHSGWEEAAPNAHAPSSNAHPPNDHHNGSVRGGPTPCRRWAGISRLPQTGSRDGRLRRLTLGEGAHRASGCTERLQQTHAQPTLLPTRDEGPHQLFPAHAPCRRGGCQRACGTAPRFHKNRDGSGKQLPDPLAPSGRD
jgi:hypothetical protein